MLAAISKHITSTQTAYIRGRCIADNLRMLNALNKVSDIEENINATIIALDAQKAFDTVSHNYIEQVLMASGLSNFVGIFRLLYKNLVNDIMINGQTGSSYNIRNGVKQGDALSCSLFILAMEPVLRNIDKNDNILQVRSHPINFKWPKHVAYADDITVITNNDVRSVQNIFFEYDRLTRASGLKLNADKTEKYDIHSRNINNPLTRLNLLYGNQIHVLNSQNRIKINGIIFDRNIAEMKQENFMAMLGKMKRHFTDWSRHSLTLLGKIKIFIVFIDFRNFAIPVYNNSA